MMDIPERHAGLLEESFGEIDGLFVGMLPQTKGKGKTTFTDRQGGRPTADQVNGIEEGFKKIDTVFGDLSKITRIDIPILLLRYYSSVTNSGKSMRFHCWNAYQNYAVSPENKLTEMARLKGTKYKYDGHSAVTGN
ncbi:hypothetical protein PM082_020740 [Marasmius tenuissimus]|nr:hypothetical protein PM082_020740 [Marasmius tenuissimus]